MSSEPLPLRAHHGMCLAYYRGYGYAPAFTAYLDELCAALELEPRQPVRMLTGVDRLCAVCPHNQAGFCESAEKVEGYDRAVLAFCGLQEGQVLSYAEFRELVDTRILHSGKRSLICGDCTWNALCSDEDGEMS